MLSGSAEMLAGSMPLAERDMLPDCRASHSAGCCRPALEGSGATSQSIFPNLTRMSGQTSEHCVRTQRNRALVRAAARSIEANLRLMHSSPPGGVTLELTHWRCTCLSCWRSAAASSPASPVDVSTP